MDSPPTASPRAHEPKPGRAPVWVWALIGAVVAGMVTVRLTGPSDLLDNDQLRPSSYVTDIVANGAWIVQRDTLGDIASKPPMCAWISALWSEASGGRVSRVALAIPSIIGIAGMCAVAVWAGSRYLGPRAGMWAALALILSPMGLKQALLVRTDSLYGFAGGLAGIVLWEAMRRGGRAWVMFWVVGTFAILVKGPVAMLLPLGGLLAWRWPRDDRLAHATEPRGSSVQWHALGTAILIAAVGGWFWMAWRDSGDEFIARVLGRELFGHVVRSGAGKPPLAEFYLPPLYYLSRYAPGAVVTAIGVWSAFRRPSDHAETRRFERYIAWWFVLGLIAFSIAPHQRPDLLTPIWVAGSLLAGREIARLTAMMPVRARGAIGAAWIVLGLAGGVAQHHVHVRDRTEVRAESAIRAFATDLFGRFDGPPPVMHITDNSSFQFYLGERITKSSPEAALACLAGEAPCAAAVSRKTDLAAMAEGAGVRVFTLAVSGGPDQYEIVIVGNSAARADPRWPGSSTDEPATRP